MTTTTHTSTDTIVQGWGSDAAMIDLNRFRLLDEGMVQRNCNHPLAPSEAYGPNCHRCDMFHVFTFLGYFEGPNGRNEPRYKFNRATLDNLHFGNTDGEK